MIAKHFRDGLDISVEKISDTMISQYGAVLIFEVRDIISNSMLRISLCDGDDAYKLIRACGRRLTTNIKDPRKIQKVEMTVSHEGENRDIPVATYRIYYFL